MLSEHLVLSRRWDLAAEVKRLTQDYDVTRCSVIAAEARGHMQACLQASGAR